MENKIGIVYSPGYGAGWSTWNEPDMSLDQTLANMIESGVSYIDVEKYCEEKYPEAYLGGLKDITVDWVDKGTQFRIKEYGGSESIVFNHSDYWLIAE